MVLTLVTPPTFEPLDLDACKQYRRRIDYVEEDNVFTALITVARERCEAFLGRAICPQTWDLVLEGWPGRPRFGMPPPQPQPYPSRIQIPLPPLASVASVKYYDTNEIEYTMDAADYYVDTDTQPGRVALQYARIWPTTVLRPANGIRVRFTAGYGVAAYAAIIAGGGAVADAQAAAIATIPTPIIQGIQFAVGHMYEIRSEVVVGRGIAAIEIPQTCVDLWWPYRAFPEDFF